VRGLFPYKPYSPEHLEEFTQFGKYAPPGNDLSFLDALDGKPLTSKSLPVLNLETEKVKTPFWYKPQQFDMAPLRQEFIDETMRSAALKQMQYGDIPKYFDPSMNLDPETIRANAVQKFDARAASNIGQRALVIETDTMMRNNNAMTKLLSQERGDLLSTTFDKYGVPKERFVSREETARLIDSSAVRSAGTAVSAEARAGLPIIAARAGKAAGILGLSIVGTYAAVSAAESYLNRGAAQLDEPGKTAGGNSKFDSLPTSESWMKNHLDTDHLLKQSSTERAHSDIVHKEIESKDQQKRG
jgi:hypothetical protein